MVQGIADSLLGRDLTGLARAGAIVAGLAIATAGYIAVVDAEMRRFRSHFQQTWLSGSCLYQFLGDATKLFYRGDDLHPIAVWFIERHITASQ